MEPKLLKYVLEADKSVLGICRGIQLLNACLGGTLYQDLDQQFNPTVFIDNLLLMIIQVTK